MKISSALVTGAGGFIGSALVRRLLSQNVETWAFIRAASMKAQAARLGGTHVLQIQHGSNDELCDLLRGKRFDVVFHLASSGVRPGDDDAAIIDGNVHLVVRLLNAVAERPPRVFVYTGSCSEYGGAAMEGDLDEGMLPQPMSLYGAAKLSAFHCGRALAGKHGIPFVNLRLFGVYGVGEHATRLIPYVIDRLARNRPADLTPGAQVRDLLNVEDAVTAILVAAQTNDIVRHAVYNVCSGDGWRIRDVGTLAARLLGKPETLLHWGKREYRSNEALRIVGCNDRFVSTTGWKPTISLAHGIGSIIAAQTLEMGLAGDCDVGHAHCDFHVLHAS